MNITLNRIFGDKCNVECQRVTFNVGGVLVDVYVSRAAGRPCLHLHGVEGTVAVVPSASNTIAVLAYSDFESAQQAEIDRAATVR